MLKTATRTMSEGHEHRHTLDLRGAWNSAEFICFQSTRTALTLDELLKRRDDLIDLVGVVVWSSTIPT